MKVKPISQKKEALSEHNPIKQRDVLDYPIEMRDSPGDLPEITQSELIDYHNSLYRFQLAKAHYEMLRSRLTLRLLQGCTIEPGNESAYYDEKNDRIVGVEDRRDHRYRQGR